MALLLLVHLVLMAVAAAGAYLAFRLWCRHGLEFLRGFFYYVVASFIYAMLNFIGEGFFTTILGDQHLTLARAYLILDMVTVPLLGAVFFLLFMWIRDLLAITPPRAVVLLFGALEAVLLVALIGLFLACFVRGDFAAVRLAVLVLDATVLIFLATAIAALLVGGRMAQDARRLRLARGLAATLGLSFAVVVLSMVALSVAPFLDRALATALAGALVFLVNFPSLGYLWVELPKVYPRARATSALEQRVAELGRELEITSREREIITRVALGLDNREIAKALHISPKTVKNHLTNIFDKTGVRSRLQLANLLNRPVEAPESAPNM